MNKRPNTSPKKKYNHTTVSIPSDIIDAIKEKIETGELKGYRNHHQFCQEAVRLRYQELVLFLKTNP